MGGKCTRADCERVEIGSFSVRKKKLLGKGRYADHLACLQLILH